VQSEQKGKMERMQQPRKHSRKELKNVTKPDSCACQSARNLSLRMLAASDES
jgi:hypothetical protein